MSKTDSKVMDVNREICSVVLRPFCSNHCLFCRLPGEDSRMPPQALVQMEQDAYQAIDEFRRAGYTRIEVSGGDPLEYDGLADYIVALRKAGFKWVRVSTNGVRLADRRFAASLLKSGVDIFRIPLYGPDADVHDQVTRIPGSFAATVAGIENIHKLGGSQILLTSLLLKTNARYLNEILDLMIELRCNEASFAPVFISNGDYSYYIPYKQQGVFFRRLLRHASGKGLSLRLMDVPYCVLGSYHPAVNNRLKPAHLARGFEVPANQKTAVPDLPRYRQKVKPAVCKDCVASDRCEGLLVNDVLRYGVRWMEPIRRMPARRKAAGRISVPVLKSSRV